MKENGALVLGGYINGYSIIRELEEKGVKDIALFCYYNSLSSLSNKINYFTRIDKSATSLKEAILKLHKTVKYIVIFPTDDLQIKNLYEIYDDIKGFCFIPFNYKNINKSLDKSVQYTFCEENNIPYPKTKVVNTLKDIAALKDLMFPLIVKPNVRKDINSNIFRSLFINNKEDYENKKTVLESLIDKNNFIASEFIPGDDTNIFAYVGYRSMKGVILNEWIGKKLNQYPDNFGVFSSATNQAPIIVQEQGRKLLEIMDLKGICQPEFKYDKRDGTYKLMEINLRSMMWHRVGNLSGVYIQHTQYLDALGKLVPKQTQNLQALFHFLYMKHEIINLIFRKSYWKYFKHNVFSKNKNYYSVFNAADMKPFMYDLTQLIKTILQKCLKLLKIK